jgi:hypothetical protein
MKMETGKLLVADKANDAKRAAGIAKIARFNQAKLTATMKFMSAVLARFDEAKHGMSAYSWVDVSTYEYNEPVKIHLTLNAKVISMKDGLVPQVIKVLMDAGFNPEKTEDYVSEWTGMRTFKLSRASNDKHVQMILNFQATVKADEAATCRKIQIGVEVKEVPKYALECDSPTEAEIQAAV